MATDERGPRLKRKKATPRARDYDPLDVMYAAAGYLGVLYESQLVYLKVALEKGDANAEDDHVIAVLQSMHNIAVEFAASTFSREPVDYDAIRAAIKVDEKALRELAADGRKLVRMLESGES
jgi:hypothetical protein